MRTTAGPVPPERTKMSAPAGLWTSCSLKLEGSSGCGTARDAENVANAIAIRALRAIVVRRPIHFSCAACRVFITIRYQAKSLDGDKSLGARIFLLTWRYG